MNKNILFGVIFVFSSSVGAMSLSDCTKISEVVNARTPMKIDSKTFVKSTFCSNSKPKPTLIYMMVTELNLVDLNATQNFQKNGWCTDPTQRKLLNEVDVRYQYVTTTGIYLGNTAINVRMCN